MRKQKKIHFFIYFCGFVPITLQYTKVCCLGMEWINLKDNGEHPLNAFK